MKPLAINNKTVLCTIILFIFCCSILYENTADDSFISFRYAKNLVLGHGLVFNPNERVEGFSTILWVLILSFFYAIKLDIVITSKVLGIASGVLVFILVAKISKKHFCFSHGLTFLGTSFLATNISILYYSISGMETIFYMFQIILMNYLLLEKRFVLAAILSGTLTLTRPEGILFLIPLFLVILLEHNNLRKKIMIMSIPIAFGLCLHLWRYSYYKSFFPNTFYAKVPTNFPLLQFVWGHTYALVNYTFNGFCGFELLFCLSILGIILLFKKKFIPLFSSIILMIIFVWLSGGDWMSFSRFYVPALPLMVLFWLGATDFICSQVAQYRYKIAVICTFILIPICFNIFNTHSSIKKLQENREFNPAMNSKNHIAIGKYLKKVASPSDIVVVNEIGAIGYYSDLLLIDMLGLADKNIPTFIKNNLFDVYADYILSKEPKFILLNDKQYPWDTKFHPLHEAVYNKMIESGLYKKENTFELNYYKNLLLFVKEDESKIKKF